MPEQEQFQNGAVIDPRPADEKARDFKFEEVVAAVNPVNWVEKPQSAWRKFPIFNQNGSGSCVAQTQAKEMGIMRQQNDGYYVHFSATDIYQRRSNRPAAGMIAVDARKQAKEGVTLEVLTPSQGMTDVQMDTALVEPYKRSVGQVFSVPNYVELPLRNIESVASFIQTTGKGAMVWFYFEYAEWTGKPVITNPNLDMAAPGTNRHSVTAVDFGLVNGKKSLIIEDSWGPQFGMGGQRVITEDFFATRNFYAGYLVNFKFNDQTQPAPEPLPIPEKPHHFFSRTLRFSPTFLVDVDVIALQNILRYEGLFPANVASTGWYGGITAKAVLAWQKKHHVDSDAVLDSLKGEIVGPKTRQILNNIYS